MGLLWFNYNSMIYKKDKVFMCSASIAIHPYKGRIERVTFISNLFCFSAATVHGP